MFVRWKKKKTKNGDHYAVQLVETVNVDGKKRQQIIKHFATITEYAIVNRQASSIESFWQSVDAGLEALGAEGLSRRKRAAFKKTIRDRLPRATAAETKAEVDDWKNTFEKLDVELAAFQKSMEPECPEESIECQPGGTLIDVINQAEGRQK